MGFALPSLHVVPDSRFRLRLAWDLQPGSLLHRFPLVRLGHLAETFMVKRRARGNEGVRGRRLRRHKSRPTVLLFFFFPFPVHHSSTNGQAPDPGLGLCTPSRMAAWKHNGSMAAAAVPQTPVSARCARVLLMVSSGICQQELTESFPGAHTVENDRGRKGKKVLYRILSSTKPTL